MLKKMFGTLFKKKDFEPLIGYAFSFKNAPLTVDEIGSPKELADSFSSQGFDVGKLFDHIETGIECHEIMKKMPSIEFSGGPNAEKKIELMENFAKRNYDAFTEISRDLLTCGELEPSIISMIAADGDIKALTIIAKNSGGFELPSELGMTPLHWAAAKGNDKAVKFLLDHCNSANHLNWFNAYPSELAEINGHTIVSPVIACKMESPSVKFSPELALKRMGCNT